MKKEKILLLGLDGATFEILNPLFEKKLLPNLAKIMAERVSGELESTIPPISVPAWPCF